MDAAREAVINAFAHRLIESGQSVEVAVYRSFIEVYSPGKFPVGVTPEDFINEVRKPIRRNPLITRTLYYSKDMESFATGLKRIQDACDEAGCRVEFYGDEYGFTVRFYRHCGEGWGTDVSAKGSTELIYGTHETENGIHEAENGTREAQNGTHETENGTHEAKNGTQRKEHLSDKDYEKQILELVKGNNKITRKQMASVLSISLRTVQRVINSMGALTYVGSGNNGHWEIHE